MPTVHLLDYVAGNIRSLVNAIEKCGYQVDWVKSPEDVARAEVCSNNCKVQCAVLTYPVETDPARRRPLWPLLVAARSGWLPPCYPDAHCFWKALYGHLRWSPSHL